MPFVTDSSILCFKYVRLILADINFDEIEKLKKKYSYIFFYLYNKKIDLEGFSITEKKTPIIDLSQSLDGIFRKFKKNTRNEIRKTEKIARLEFKNANNGIGQSFRFYKKIKKKDGVCPDIKADFKGCKFFNAYLAGKLIVSISCYDNRRILRLKHIVSLRKEKDFDSRIIGYATRRIIWEICKYGKGSNYKKIDLGGINFSEQGKGGVTQFKESFGAEIIDVYVYRYETRIFKLLKKILELFKRKIN